MEISGPVISSLALLLNEFATNAVKYGALSATAGQIQIHCADRAGASSFPGQSWEGPGSRPPWQAGFGDFLVRATVAGQLGGEISRDWKPEGLVIRLSVSA
jgi:two-component sensor histidine kinase